MVEHCRRGLPRLPGDPHGDAQPEIRREAAAVGSQDDAETALGAASGGEKELGAAPKHLFLPIFDRFKLVLGGVRCFKRASRPFS